MSLLTDSIFIKALKGSAAISKAVSKRIYGTFIPLPDAQVENVELPYIIVSFEGSTPVPDSKDGDMEGYEMQNTVGVLLVAATLPALHTLMEAVRSVIADSMRKVDPESPVLDDYPTDYDCLVPPIEYDPYKHAYHVKFIYVCTVNNNY